MQLCPLWKQLHKYSNPSKSHLFSGHGYCLPVVFWGCSVQQDETWNELELMNILWVLLKLSFSVVQMMCGSCLRYLLQRELHGEVGQLTGSGA